LAEPETILTSDAAWSRLVSVAAHDRDASILEQFEKDPERLERLSVTAAGLYIDLSKQSWTRAGLAAALNLAQARDVEGARDALFAGEAVNTTEGRAVLHPALRASSHKQFFALGSSITDEVHRQRQALKAFATGVREGTIRGATGKPIQAVVHIGIGGSDLGPRVVWEGLRTRFPTFQVRFVANIDPADRQEALAGLDPETTLVIIVSKTFTTLETLANAKAVRDWLQSRLPDGADIAKQIVGVTATPEKADEFGCGQTFAFSDWVGGRFSLWSSVSLSVAIALGWDVFEELLRGAEAMDDHFVTAPLDRNGPVLMALAQIYNVDGLGRTARSVAPYAYVLRRFPAYLQQLEMESNGKRVTRDGRPIEQATCPVIFGEVGSNGQHAFFQQLHQGPQVVPTEFIIVRQTHDDGPENKLWANALAQSRALMVGQSMLAAYDEMLAAGASEEEAARLAPHKTFPGNRPSSMIAMDKVTPSTLGALIALYEHKTFVEGVIWDLNSFDQWGVELGKAMASSVMNVAAGGADELDPSTLALLKRLT